MLKKVLFIFVVVILCPLWPAADDWKVAIREWDAPVATPDGRLYLACSGVNKVGVVEVSR